MKLPTKYGQYNDYWVRAYEVNSQQFIHPPALLKLMHETAMQNVIHLKMSAWDLEPLCLSWVLMRMYINFHSFPKVKDHVQVLTYPAGFERLLTYRDYLVYDATGNLVAEAASTWLLMDTATRKMAAIPGFISNLQADLPDVSDCLPRYKQRFPTFQKIDFQKTVEVGWFDLDWNKHLNNVQYLHWMLESLGEIPANRKLQRIEIQYKAECRWKEVLSAEAQQLDEHTFLHQLKKVEEGQIAAQAMSYWQT